MPAPMLQLRQGLDLLLVCAQRIAASRDSSNC